MGLKTARDILRSGWRVRSFFLCPFNQLGEATEFVSYESFGVEVNDLSHSVF